mmetsp:Transcript_2318/g.3008  ORF Transcript_2318/g.3008 Transcript_2318/m.3008 type:complete len:295 (-) Transcript_2318:38-922(-)
MPLILVKPEDRDEHWDAGAVDGHPWIFVGSLSAAESHKHLCENNVTHVLTVASKNLPVATLPVGIDHRRVEIDDHPNADFLNVASQCVEFIDSCNAATAAATAAEDDLHPPRSILVHCASGVSRSVTAVIAWLMSPQRGYSFDEALTAVRSHRPHANPNIGFAIQMQVLEKHSGCIDGALADWKSRTRKDQMERAATRRRLANSIHAAVDEFEVRVQRFRSMERSEQECVGEFRTVSAKALLKEANELSDRLDRCHGDLEGLPEDRVAKIIFKSARSKVELLITTIAPQDNFSK